MSIPNLSANNHILLTQNGDYSRHLLNLCERTAQSDKYVLIITQRQAHLTDLLQKSCSLLLLERLLILPLTDIENAPRCIVQLHDSATRPDLIIFDLHSIIAELRRWPPLPSLANEPMLQQRLDAQVRHIANCAAAFCNYNETLRKCQQQQNLLKKSSTDTVIVLPTETHPLTPAQCELLIALYFCGSECHTDFGEMAERVIASQDLL